ncbi:hypothetical protein [Streptomyces virginiae]|nr:hypothetical protein [Streptomyces virginiae]MCX4721164.1 hypothetical protein [Streptomyces virginiae]MCX5275676.1 hypothetical protein [Streptomyces virginiae]
MSKSENPGSGSLVDFAAVAWLGVAEAGEGVDQWPAWACSAAG